MPSKIKKMSLYLLSDLFADGSLGVSMLFTKVLKISDAVLYGHLKMSGLNFLKKIQKRIPNFG